MSFQPAFDRKSTPSVGDDDNGSLNEEHDPIGGSIQSGKWYGNSVSGSVAPTSVLEQVWLVSVRRVISECNSS